MVQLEKKMHETENNWHFNGIIYPVTG
jgi:hypothetical protein